MSERGWKLLGLILVFAGIYLMVMFGGGCGGVNATRAAYEHPAEGGGWYREWDAIPFKGPMSQQFYLGKLREDADEVLVVICDYPEALATGPLGGNESSPFPIVWAFRAYKPLPAVAIQDTWTQPGSEAPVVVTVYETAGATARIGWTW